MSRNSTNDNKGAPGKPFLYSQCFGHQRCGIFPHSNNRFSTSAHQLGALLFSAVCSHPPVKVKGSVRCQSQVQIVICVLDQPAVTGGSRSPLLWFGSLLK